MRYVLVCPSCGDIWMKLELSPGEWRGLCAGCEKCPPWPLPESIPGSVITTVFCDELPLLPPELLRREFDLHMHFYSTHPQIERVYDDEIQDLEASNP